MLAIYDIVAYSWYSCCELVMRKRGGILYRLLRYVRKHGVYGVHYLYAHCHETNCRPIVQWPCTDHAPLVNMHIVSPRERDLQSAEKPTTKGVSRMRLPTGRRTAGHGRVYPTNAAGVWEAVDSCTHSWTAVSGVRSSSSAVRGSYANYRAIWPNHSWPVPERSHRSSAYELFRCAAPENF
jgi:hypothetical protein